MRFTVSNTLKNVKNQKSKSPKKKKKKKKIESLKIYSHMYEIVLFQKGYIEPWFAVDEGTHEYSSLCIRTRFEASIRITCGILLGIPQKLVNKSLC